MRHSYIGIVWMIVMCVGLNTESAAGCKGLSAEEVGTNLGNVVLEIAQAFVEANVWSDPDCRSPRSKEVRRLCSLQGDFDKAVERVNKGIDKRCINEEGSFAQSPEFYTFQVVKSAIASTNPKIRWQALMRMYVLCDDPDMLTEAGSKGCGGEIESAALKLLMDQDSLNRHLALEVLNSRFVTESSRSALEEVIKSGRSQDGLCPHGFTSASSTAQTLRPWDEIARGISEGRYACEPQLAREALQRLDK